MKKGYALAYAAIAATACGWSFGNTGWLDLSKPGHEASNTVRARSPVSEPQTGKEPGLDALSNEQLLDSVQSYRAQKVEADNQVRACLKALRTRTDKLREQIETLESATETTPNRSVPSTPAPRRYENGVRP